MPTPTREKDIVNLACELVFSGQLCVSSTYALNVLRFTSDEINPATWSRFVATASHFFSIVLRDPWPVQLVRMTSASIREHATSNSEAFRQIINEVEQTIKTEDSRVAYWAHERQGLQTLRLWLPPEGVIEVDKLKTTMVKWLPSWAHPVGFRGAGNIEIIPENLKEAKAFKESENSVSAPEVDTRRSEQAPTEEVSHLTTTPEVATTDNGARKDMSQTFNLNDTASAKRTLYQFWVWDEDTDEVLDHASVIVAGDSDQEATMNLKNLLKTRLADKGLNNSIRFRVEKIANFQKTAPEKRVSVDAMLNTLRDVLVSGEG